MPTKLKPRDSSAHVPNHLVAGLPIFLYTPCSFIYCNIPERGKKKRQERAFKGIRNTKQHVDGDEGKIRRMERGSRNEENIHLCLA